MKKLILLAILILGVNSFGRDYEYNEKRDIINPIVENSERMSRFSSDELGLETAATNKNIQEYSQFHRELDQMDRGTEKK